MNEIKEPILLTVIVPIYNQVNYIKDCINSLKKCGVSDMEIIVVDDGSTDETPQIVGSMDGIRYFREEHRGLPTARNSAFSRSRGKYIAFLDSDDQWLPGVPEKILKLLNKYPEIDMVFADALMGNPREGYKSWIEIAGQKEFFELPHRKLETGFRILQPIPFLRRLLVRNAIFIGAVILRRDAFIKIGGFDSTPTGSEDWELWMRMAMHMKIGYYNEPLAIYTRHPDSMSANHEYMAKGFCISLNKILNKPLPIKYVERRFIKKRLKEMSFYYAYSAYDRGDYISVRKRLIERMKMAGLDIKGIAYLSLCLFPNSLINQLRKIKRFFLK